MLMNEELLEKLLKEKKDQVYHFGQSEEDFIAGFMEKIDHRPQKIHFWRYAAIFAVAACLVIMFLSMISAKIDLPGKKTAFDPMQESLRLFGDEVAVLFVGNDLVIGERMNTESPSNVLNVKLANNMELKIACADNDSISVNAPGVSGNVIVSRSDRQTLVLDVDLFIQGKRINTQIPVDNSKDIRMHS
jgi:hypothetical protein